MLNMKRILGLFLALGMVTPATWALDDLMSRQMVDQARDWSQKGRDDLAAPEWRKVLSVEPSHPEALIKLGLIEARAGNLKEAQTLYQRASRLTPPPKGLNALSQALGLMDESLPIAKSAPKTTASEPLKRQIVSKDHPPVQRQVVDPDTSRVSSVRGETWEERRLSLESSAQANPGDVRHLVALARHLAQRELTRREAIRQIEALSGRGLGTAQTKKIWKKALLALTPRQGDQPLFTSYLSRYPTSTSVARRLNVLDGKEPIKESRQKGESRSGKTKIKNSQASDDTLKPSCSNDSCK
jgi:tetratricopeptide (TPR) repeat protein